MIIRLAILGPNVLKEIADNPAETTEVVAFFGIKRCRNRPYPTKSIMLYRMGIWLQECRKAKSWRNLIQEKEIDILIDLSGHYRCDQAARLRMETCPRSRRPGSAILATTGVAAIDYLIADEYGVAEGEEAFFTEKVWKLPNTRLCFTPPDLIVDVTSPPCLEAGYVTFGCFNKLMKMTDAVVKLWAQILDAAPESRLLLKANMLEKRVAAGAICH